jgi:hypothetical protein
MDHLLPSARHNGELVLDETWGTRLIGIAVGPVQGMLDRTDDAVDDSDGGVEGLEDTGNDGRLGGRRWRLMVHFQDNTVYSYELGKYGGGDAVGLGDLVV